MRRKVLATIASSGILATLLFSVSAPIAAGPGSHGHGLVSNQYEAILDQPYSGPGVPSNYTEYHIVEIVLEGEMHAGGSGAITFDSDDTYIFPRDAVLLYVQWHAKTMSTVPPNPTDIHFLDTESAIYISQNAGGWVDLAADGLIFSGNDWSAFTSGQINLHMPFEANDGLGVGLSMSNRNKVWSGGQWTNGKTAYTALRVIFGFVTTPAE